MRQLSDHIARSPQSTLLAGPAHSWMRRQATAVSTRWILRYLRVDDSRGASVARDAARALASTVSTARADKHARFNIVGFCSSPITSWLGFTVGSHQAERGTGASRDGRGGGKLWGSAKLNQEIIASRSAGEILAIVEDRGESFNEVNVATTVNKLSKVAKARDDLRRDPRYRRLLELVRLHCGRFRAREVSNVAHGLGMLCANRGAGNIDKETAELLMRCLLYTSPSPRDLSTSRMPSSA